MIVRVLLASGEEDVWGDDETSVVAEISQDLGGALMVRSDLGDDSQGGALLAIYAGGMWMRCEFVD